MEPISEIQADINNSPGLARTGKWKLHYNLSYAGPAIRPLVQEHGQGYDNYAKYNYSVYLRHDIHLFSPPGNWTD